MTRIRALIGVAVGSVLISCALHGAWARDLKITIPRRSELTPVQRLNRDGVEAVRKHQYEKAEAIFYKAYLFDPADPFTLNNLGYISELQGKLDRAEKFYHLAAEQGCDALIDVSSNKQLKGKPMLYAVNDLKDTPMRVNRMNVEAIGLIEHGRAIEADRILRKALTLEPNDPFTLNNLGVADEATGDLQDALAFYNRAAALDSSEPIVLSLRESWRGKPVSKMAAESAQNLQKRMENMSNAQMRAMMLSFQGVSAANRNDWNTAKQDFAEAYRLDPGDAFTLNNLGYLAEKRGDLETAQFYYSHARSAFDANAKVGLATKHPAQGQPLFAVASESSDMVGDELVQYKEERRTQTGPIVLIPRGNGSSQQNPAHQSNQSPQPPH